MKNTMKLIAIALPLAFAGSAMATPLSAVTSSANVQYDVQDGVATIYGNVDSRIEKTLIGNEAAKLDGVVEVRNYLFVTK